MTTTQDVKDAVNNLSYESFTRFINNLARVDSFRVGVDKIPGTCVKLEFLWDREFDAADAWLSNKFVLHGRHRYDSIIVLNEDDAVIFSLQFTGLLDFEVVK